MTAANTRSTSFAVSLGLHLFILLLLTLSFHPETRTVNAPPAAVELWSAPPMTRGVVMPDPTPAPVVAPEPTPTPEPDVTPEVRTPDIAVAKKKPEPPKPEPKPEKKPEPKPEKKPEPKPEKKPEPKPEAKPEKKADAKKATPAESAKKPAAKNARQGSFDVDDELADLGSTNTKVRPNSNRTQAGSKDGVPGGSAGGIGAGGSGGKGYEGLVVARVRPLVQVPDGLNGNPTAVVQVTLLPSLEVRDVKLVQSSGNPQYDEAVQRAVMAARTFPALPAGMSFSDVRVMKLKFRPK